ncbi:MAG: hypothetical protein IJN14_00375 [Ruminococcus sp.]|nr:hypothetical protein [Ruminococcus sp.]
MKILTIHGYGGVAENFACTSMRNLGFETVSPQIFYDDCTPEELLNQMKVKIRESDCKMVVGTSLGGFFALALGIEFNLPTFLVNPCLMPFLHLPRLGYKGDIHGFMRIFPTLADVNPDDAFAVIGGEDEIIDTHDFTKKIIPNHVIVPDGKHSGGTLNLPEHFRNELKRRGII